jgi:inorganic pyrophosphatase
MKILFYITILFIPLIFISCEPDVQLENEDINYYSIPTFSDNNNINVVIEIPAGTNHKIEYNSELNEFINYDINGQIRIIDFLPYPGNYGFIPSTLMDKDKGGDGDALDVLVISESVDEKTIMEVIPIAVLQLKDRGEIDNKIIAVPADTENRIVNIETFDELIVDYENVKNIIETWFSSYKGEGKMEVLSWGNEKEAMKEINKWRK